MDKLWAPWRGKYVTTIAGKPKGCVFCTIENNKRRDKTSFVVHRGEHAFIVLNIYPYNNGHLMVIPNRHVNDTAKLRIEERNEVYELVERIKVIMKQTLNCQGFNVGINLGKAAGAGFPGHVHVHIVPRWKGDVNFMPVTAQTKVISQSLKEVYHLLVDAYKKKY